MLLLLTAAVVLQPKADYPALRQRLLRGNYAEARTGYEALLQEDKPAAAAFVGLARVHRETGEYARAADALDAGLKRYSGDATLLAHRADLALSLGKWDDAAADAEAAIKTDEKNFLARWVRVRLLRDRGDVAAAEKEVRWFVKAYTDASNAEKDITDPDLLLIVAQAGAENARWNNKPEQFRFILNEVCGDAAKHDPDFWPIEAFAGRLLLEKHNRADAAEALDKALKLNPSAVPALVGKGLLAREELDAVAAGRFADLALKVNPRHPDALRLRADTLLAEGDTAAAERQLLAAKLVNPRDEATLARLAAIAHLLRKPEAVAAIEKEVLAFDAKPGVFYAELAEVLVARKQYPRAEECFKKASELRPDLAAPRAGLGLLFMQLGREPEAKVQLDAAFKADPFHVRVSNALKVLKHLAAYETFETPHFVIKYDAKADAVFAAWLGEHLELWHAEFTKLYGAAPPGKLLVEVFATREMFSGRVLSLPGLPGAAQGASTGPLIAIPSPKVDGRAAAYNWASVARHELTHAFNLTQTGFLVPIWLTEGLAVKAERSRRFDTTLPLLRDRLAAGTAFDLDTIGRGYHNFGQPSDVMLAYHQGLLYVEYIEKTHGPEAVAKLLDAYKLGLTTGDALRRACGVEKEAFEKGYREFLRTQVKGLPRAEKVVPFADLEAAHKKDPGDPDVASRLAAEYVRRGKAADARKLVDAALEKEKGHPNASLVKARLLQRDKDTPGALAVLELAAKENPDDTRVLLALGKLAQEANETERAVAAFEKIRAQAPADTDVLEALAKIYASTGARDKLISVVTEVAGRATDNLAVRLQLAKLYQDAGNHARAEEWSREALFVDVSSAPAREILVAALRAQNKAAEAEKIEKRYAP
ncbi:tetratricopeptide repeat protein [Gemmata sp.]|uniref:tetratricopeptide repeat protein n=1 Tax=Gemmata sp. TaxID=1914242 RepID=UPI003F6FE9CF